MIAFLFAAVVSTATQGSAVPIRVPNEPHLKSVQVVWRQKTVPAFREGEVWTTILGVDLDEKPGQHRAKAVLTMDDGRVERRDIAVDVRARKFPTTRVNVEEKFVELNKADLARSRRESKEAGAIYARITTDIVPDEAFTVPIPSAASSPASRAHRTPAPTSTRRPGRPSTPRTEAASRSRKTSSSPATP
jgi:hypothetical protein